MFFERHFILYVSGFFLFKEQLKLPYAFILGRIWRPSDLIAFLQNVFWLFYRVSCCSTRKKNGTFAYFTSECLNFTVHLKSSNWNNLTILAFMSDTRSKLWSFWEEEKMQPQHVVVVQRSYIVVKVRFRTRHLAVFSQFFCHFVLLLYLPLNVILWMLIFQHVRE